MGYIPESHPLNLILLIAFGAIQEYLHGFLPSHDVALGYHYLIIGDFFLDGDILQLGIFFSSIFFM